MAKINSNLKRSVPTKSPEHLVRNARDNKGNTSRGRAVVAGKRETRSELKNHDKLVEKYRYVVKENIEIRADMRRVESKFEKYHSELNELISEHGDNNVDNSQRIHDCLHEVRDELTSNINDENVSSLEKKLLERKLEEINDFIHKMETSSKEEYKSICNSIASALIGFASGVGMMFTANAASVSTMLAYTCSVPITPVNLGLCVVSCFLGRKINVIAKEMIGKRMKQSAILKAVAEIKDKGLHKSSENNMETETGDRNRDDGVVDSLSEMDES